MRFDPEFGRDFGRSAITSAAIMPVRPRARIRNPAMQVMRAVMRLAGSRAELIRHAERPWASITFSGTRHAITLAFDGAGEGAEGIAAGEAFIAALPEHEFTIARQLVADAAVTGVVHDTLPHPRMVVEVELLLLEEG